MRFPPSFIERLRSHFLISEVIGRRIAIKKHGREFQALCPFHNEKTPSFTVNDEKGFFHCFGCGAHGDAIGFIMRHDRLSYPETIEALAREAGIPLPELSAEQVRKFEAEKTLYDVCEAAGQWFERQLSASAGMMARDYVVKRGLKAETIRAFRIGYAPDERAALHDHLKAAGFAEKLQAEAGLIIVPEQGGAPYDRFRGRLMFPIRNASGKIIAFGGRLIINNAGKHLPKYLNSPETPLFKKGELLYNLDLARKAARDKDMIIVMEGYMDVVSTWQAGIPYAVATLGTAITPEHLRLVWQLSKEPVMRFDQDAAGFKAAMRAIEVALPLLKPGYSLRFARMPRGEDPDSYVQKYGKEKFEGLLVQSRRLSQMIWEAMASQFNTGLPESRAALEGALKKLTDTIADPTVKVHYSSYFRKMLWAKGAPQPAPQTRSAEVERMARSHHSAVLEALARRLLSILLAFPQLLHKSQVEETLSQLAIQAPALEALRQALLTAPDYSNIDNREAFLGYIGRQMRGDFVDSLNDGAIALPCSTPEDGVALWNETIDAYEEEREFTALEESVQKEWNEAACQRLVELKARRAARTFASVKEDVA